jgi:hypothetical protein
MIGASIDVDQFAHALGEVLVGSPISDLDPAPGPVGVHEDKQIDRAVSAILAVVGFKLATLGRNGLAHFADELGRALVEADHGLLWIRRFCVEVENILHARDVFPIDLRDAPHVFAPRLEMVLSQPATHGLRGQLVVIGEPDHLIGQKLKGPAGSPGRRL